MFRHLAIFCCLTVLPLAACKKKSAEEGAAAAPDVPASAEEGAPVDGADAGASGAASPAPASAETAETAEAAPAQPGGNQAEVVVLCYHRIEGKAGGALSISAEEFEQQMQQIKDQGLTVISMKDFLAWRRGEKNIPEKSVLITIDDGYVSSYDVGWPILKKFNYPFTMFVYLNYIEKGGKSITWAQLGEMRDAGVDINSHTISHQDLRRKPSKVSGDYETWLKQELEESKKTLEQQLGIKVTTLAYPFGLHNEKVHAAMKEAGYEAGFTTYGQRLGPNAPAYSLGRYDVTTKDARGTSSFTVATSFAGMVAPGGGGVMAQDAAVGMITEPANNATIPDTQPMIRANLSAMGEFDGSSLQMRISGLGLVQANFDAASKTISYKPAKPLAADTYTVILSGKSGERKLETRWSFTVDPSAKATEATEEPLPPRTE